MVPSLTAFFLTVVLALAGWPAPQSQKQAPPEKKEECGTVIPPEQLAAESARKEIAPLALAPPTETPYYLPMTIHIVHRSDGTGGLELHWVEIAMRDLNRNWEQVGIQFFIYGEIDHIYDDAHFNVPNTTAARDALRRVNPVANTINVYFTELKGVCGASSTTSMNPQGVVMDNNCSGGESNPSTFAHEIGHYFNLYHTHETSSGAECPNGSNCSEAGDFICDTPADPGLLGDLGHRVNADCSYDNSATTPANCDNTPYNPPTRNLMSYSTNFCRDQFTANQISKVLQVLRYNDRRKDLITSGKRYVDPMASASKASCNDNAPCRTLAEAVQSAQHGTLIFLKPGAYKAPSFGDKRLALHRWGTAGVVEIVP